MSILSEDIIKETGLTEDQVKAVTSHIEGAYVPELKKEWDGKANQHAEGILDGAAKYVREKTGLEIERNQGEKYGDYLTRISETALQESKNALADKQKELDEKIKNFKGGADQKAKIEQLESEKDELLKQVADLEPLKGLDEKYEQAQQSLSKLKLDVAFNTVKPNFPDTTNQYEASAKWGEFKNSILEKYTIELGNDGKPVAIDKENHHKVYPLDDLVKSDQKISDLLAGRQQKGTGSDPAGEIEVEGVPFKVKKGATSEELSKLVREHLTKKLGGTMHPQFTKQFEELYAKVKQSA